MGKTRWVTPDREVSVLPTSLEEYLSLASELKRMGSLPELEVRFGTLNRSEYDRVLEKLVSSGFVMAEEKWYMTVYQDAHRIQLHGQEAIERYIQLQEDVVGMESMYDKITAQAKRPYRMVSGKDLPPLDMSDEFGFRVALQQEAELKREDVLKQWKRQGVKSYRYIQRLVFVHPDMPRFKVDASCVKQWRPKRVRPVQEVFVQADQYEVELEWVPEQVASASDAVADAVKQVRSMIKTVLSGLQCTNFPISLREQKEVGREYLAVVGLLSEDTVLSSKHFVGPNPVTMQSKHLAKDGMVSIQREGYAISDKADGLRALLFVSKTGKIYLITQQAQVVFTGAVTSSKECRETVVDGEWLLHDKHGRWLNLFAAFDLYWLHGKEQRTLPFMGDVEGTRYAHLLQWYQTVAPEHVMGKSLASPLLLQTKTQVYRPDEPIFATAAACWSEWSISDGLYDRDGLIFTPVSFPVGGDVVGGKAGPKRKQTWPHLLKWKPSDQNTVDFLVSTVKTADGLDALEHDPMTLAPQKVVRLLCGFQEGVDGCPDPWQALLQGKKVATAEHQPYRAVPFCATEPPFDPDAGICRVTVDPPLHVMRTETGEIFADDTVVECRYDVCARRWIPMRVRHDKTARYRAGESEFGNAFRVCTDVWRAIHDPIVWTTEGGNEKEQEEVVVRVESPDDVYYHADRGCRTITGGLRAFHNQYVKRRLLQGVCAGQVGWTLLDLGCGKGGDLYKWKSAELSFVLGVDLSRDNLWNGVDGACVRYLRMREQFRTVPSVMFLCGDMTRNLRDGSAFAQFAEKDVAAAVFGSTHRSTAAALGPAVADQFAVAQYGFHVVTCHFAMHYAWSSMDALQGFMANLCECVAERGLFVATAYDGQEIFQLLQARDEVSITTTRKMWSITKAYTATEFRADASSVGYEVAVYQESINQTIVEYLVHFEYLVRVMDNYGFELVPDVEAIACGFPNASDSFRVLYEAMVREMESSPTQALLYHKACMSEEEKQISFLNRYCVFRKMRSVDPRSVVLSVEEPTPLVATTIDPPTLAPTPIPTSTSTSTSIPKTRKKRPSASTQGSVKPKVSKVVALSDTVVLK